MIQAMSQTFSVMIQPSTAKTPETPQELPKYNIDDFQFVSALGSGGFASVHEVFHKNSTTASLKKQIIGDELEWPSLSSTQDDTDSGISCSSNQGSTHNNSRVLGYQTSTSLELPALDSVSVTSSSTTSSVSTSDTTTSSTGSMALKKLHSKTLNSAKTRRLGVQGLRNEAKILSKIPQHENIIALYGTSEQDWAGTNECTTEEAEKYFLLMERLEQPLDAVFEEWRQEQKKNVKTHSAASGKKSGMMTKLVKKMQTATSAKRKSAQEEEKAQMAEQKRLLELAQQTERIKKIGVHVAKAMTFLHENNVLFRDLKPSNVGLDQAGNVKLFDFGLACSLENGADTVVKGRNGTLRYMAPEVANPELECRGFSSDVYSFGMFLFELLTMEKPYQMVADKTELDRLVCTANGFTNSSSDRTTAIMNKNYNNNMNMSNSSIHRPNLSKVASPAMRQLVKACLQKPSARPDFTTIVEQLHQEIHVLQEIE